MNHEAGLGHKLGEWMQRGIDLYKENFGLLFFVVLVGSILGSITSGILAGPMAAGMAVVTLGVIDKRKPKPVFEDLFKGFDFFVPSFLFTLVWGAALAAAAFLLSLLFCVLSPVVIVLVTVVASAFLMFGVFFIVDRKMDFWAASLASINVVKANFLPLLGISVLAALLSMVGVIACGVGVVFTLPLYPCIISVVYRDVVRNAAPARLETGAAKNTEAPKK